MIKPMTKLEAEIIELRAQLANLAERVRLDAIAEAFLRDEHDVRAGDYAVIDGFPTRITNISSEGKWTYFNGRNSIEPFRVPPSDDVERLYMIAEVAEIVAKVTTKTEHAAKYTNRYTDRILKILDENVHGLRTCEIAGKIEQALNYAFGILKSLERQGRVARHGSRYNTLWTLPGVSPVQRIETIPAATVAVLGKATGPMDSRRLHDEIGTTLLRSVGKRPSGASLKRGISRLISNGTLAYHGANEHGALYILAQKTRRR